MTTIAALLTCHNRRPSTVATIRSLKRAVDPVEGLDVHVFLTDDGSTDGTAEAVREVGLTVEVVQGTGQLYWNGGMVRAWRAALASGRAFKGFLLLNDDTTLDETALATLLSCARTFDERAIVVGAARDPVTGRVTYGGLRRLSPWHPGRLALLDASEDMQEADTFNGNCVLVPAHVVETVGTLDPAFTHAMGDIDLGLRATRSGVSVVVPPGTVGVCSRNDVRGTWRDTSLPLRMRLRLLESPKGLPRREWSTFLRRHGAPLPWLLALAPATSVILSTASKSVTTLRRLLADK